MGTATGEAPATGSSAPRVRHDQELPHRGGASDRLEILSRATANLRGGEDPSGSTIPQQVAKNVFLPAERSALRKALEAATGSAGCPART